VVLGLLYVGVFFFYLGFAWYRSKDRKHKPQLLVEPATGCSVRLRHPVTDKLLVETTIFLKLLLPEFIHIQINKPIIASLPQMQASTLDRLLDDILQIILDLAMARDSPFYIDDSRLGLGRSTLQKRETSSSSA
jgi:hypothetical protein